MKHTIRTPFVFAFCLLLAVSCQEDEAPSPEQPPPSSLGPIALTYPSDKASDIVPGFQFTWEPVQNAVSYRFLAGTSSGLSAIVVNNLTTTSVVIDTIRYWTTYYWNIIAVDKDGKTVNSSRYSFTTKKNWQILDNTVQFEALSQGKKIVVYLPPDYEKSSDRYPVLYMNESSENLSLFVRSSSGVTTDQGWQVDKTLDRMFQESGRGIIVIAIISDNDWTNVMFPWVSTGAIDPTLAGQGGAGQQYVQSIVESLKPFIDNNYRTLPEKENTGIMGAIAGGLNSLYAMLSYPEIFGKAGVFSPFFSFTDNMLFDFAEENAKFLSDNKLYYFIGEPNMESIEDSERMNEILQKEGFSNIVLNIDLDPPAWFEPIFWARGFPQAVDWLY